jgi:hypothetical protein
MARRRRKVRAHERDDRSSFEDDFLHLVAAGVAICGIAPSRVASAQDVEPAIITRALQRAYSSGILRLNFLPKHRLAKALAGYRKGTIFHVVPDRFKPLPFDDVPIMGLDSVCITAAQAIRQRIETLLQEDGSDPIRIGVTGGYSLAKTVEALAGEIQNNPPPGAERLEFVALNSAMPITRHQISSNHLVTRLAMIYSDGVFVAKHMAVAANCGAKQQARYNQAVEELHLVLVSGGAVQGSYLSDYLGERNIELPADAAGDLAYVLLTHDGKRAECSAEAKQAIAELQPALRYEHLLTYAADGKMIVVLSEHRNVLWTQKRSQDHPLGLGRLSKLPLALALMRVRLASEIITGQTLAEELIRTLKLTVTQPTAAEVRAMVKKPYRSRGESADGV